MKRSILLLFISLCSISLAQTPIQYAKVKVDLTEKTIEELGQLGIEVDHGIHAPGRFLINVFSNAELALIEGAGFEAEVLIEDMEAYVLNRPQNPETIEFRNGECGEDEEEEYTVPANFELGSMAGFFTYQEMLDHLDAMVEQYPELITPRTPVDGIQSIEGRPIYWLRISDNPNTDESDEPEVLYNALHHAREPNSMSLLIYFMWHVLENYATDPQIQALVNNTELYFMPCVNPDGYIYNETTNPNGGGYWRKNRRMNSNGSFGVDLNRNYGHQWGYNNAGSSGVSTSQTYRGTEPFSEPETQAVKKMCEDHQFKISLNYHTSGNLLIYPWGYTSIPPNDAETFYAFADLMTMENNYFAGTVTEALGYWTNGGANDWMYGETTSKPKIISFIPEVGTDFWPDIDEIIPNCQNTLEMNLMAARLVHNYGLIEEQSPYLVDGLQGNIEYLLQRYGLKNGTLTVSISPLTDNIASVGMPETYSIPLLGSITEMIEYELVPDIQTGEKFSFLLSVFNGNFTLSDTITKRYMLPGASFHDDGEHLNNWYMTGEGSWGITNETAYTPPFSIADSPNMNYPPNTVSELALNQYISIINDEEVTLYFWTKWLIEEGFDYVQLMVKVNQEEPFPACGRYTTIGTEFQDEGNPLWDGIQIFWKEEAIDLTPYVTVGDSVTFSFRLVSDEAGENQGFYFDDLSLRQIGGEVISSEQQLVLTDFMLSQNRPNPATTYTSIDVDLEGIDFQSGSLQVFNTLGQMVWEEPVVKGGLETVQLNTQQWKAGVYTYRLVLDGVVYGVKRMEVY